MACVQVFLQGGRIAFVVSPDFDQNMTAVRVYNTGSRSGLAANATVHSMRCGWASSLPMPKGL